jgi:phage terminase small subunit
MPVLANHRRELFAQLLFQGFTKSEAYQKAGFKGHSGNASILSRHPEVEARIAEIRAEANAALVPVGTSAIAARANVTPESLMDQAEKILAGAMNGHQYGAAVSALKEKGILSGKRIERSEIGGPGEFDHLSDQELERMLFEGFVEFFVPRLRIINGSITLDGTILKERDD